MKFLSKQSFILIVLVVTVVLAVGVLMVQKKADIPVPVVENGEEQDNQGENEENITETVDTSDWQTYRNEEYGFEVKYPRDIYSIKDDDYVPMVSFIAVSRELKERYGDIQIYIAGSSDSPLDETDKKSITDNYRLMTLNNKEVYYSEMKIDCSKYSGREYCHVPGSFFFIAGEDYINIRRITFNDVEPPERTESVFVEFISNFKIL